MLIPRVWFCCVLITFIGLLNFAVAKQPNFLIIMADDCTFNDLPLYGGENAKTPNIDRLAKEGLTFNRAYLSEAMCQPCRAELFSGQFPMSNGCAWNHSASHPTTTSMPQHLGKLGYRVGLAGKVHVKPQRAFPFEIIKGFDQSCVRNPTQPHNCTSIGQFMSRSEDPFCLVVALVEPHVPWVMGDKSQYPPKTIKLPPNIADTPKTRDSYAAYLAEITYMDGQVGEILETLEQTGKADDTVVFFTSEQGSQFPGNKWTNWDTGVHTALVARWPGVIAPNLRTDAIVQYADVLPTLMTLAGDDHSEGVNWDGRSFAGVLRGETGTHRDYAYGVHNNLPEGPAYPTRTVTNGEFRYIRNLTPNEIYIEKHLMGKASLTMADHRYWSTWMAFAEQNAQTYNLVKRFMVRPSEELYHTAKDPHEMNNLANDPAYGEIKTKLSAELDAWLEAEGDPGAAQDTKAALQAARKGQHLFLPPDHQ